MLEVVGSPPNLPGRTCEALLCQQYWYRGELAEAANVLYLKVDGLLWQRFLFDSGILFWREVDAPDAIATSPTDEYHYPIADIGARFGLPGQRISGMSAHDDGRRAELHLTFGSGSRLTLWNQNDLSHVAFHPAL